MTKAEWISAFKAENVGVTNAQAEAAYQAMKAAEAKLSPLAEEANQIAGRARLAGKNFQVDWTDLELVGFGRTPEKKASGEALPEGFANQLTGEFRSKYGKLSVLISALRCGADAVSTEPLFVMNNGREVLNPVFKLWKFTGYDVFCRSK